MKRFAIFLLLICSTGSLLLAQTDVLEFVSKKPTDTGYVVYFDVVGLNNTAHAESLLEIFLDDSNVSGGRFFVSSANKDRYQLYVSSNVTANYILSILQSQGCDYDYSSIIRNGVVPKENPVSAPPSNIKRSAVDYPGFPEFVNTGNPQQDEKNYMDAKNKWISEHPQEYQQLLNETEKK
ncbi:MAG TPA: hypothetical protein PLZ52_01665 [Bacteroidales bacterium]|nr:hypothetical protein [Bacteroidales bacterium]HQL70376.1 hypothetical protein [Bacteroidales bacterium]